ncbi:MULTISPECIES: type VI secretion system Vgr family protein [unclassified Pseudomonas]|uniref:type VI secretion system Vgr family protein n=1 Tax=unclassified Pseudomonas TaxID=196821 RepID=UPI00119B5DFE|nr:MULTISPECIES: type VI secretion system tip protein TssI/VgrG [unclassified Pseudomonas]TWC06643.1 type VI secretion system secreted protein VgrG [Pseudomonas sp. SJZ075]TWC26625.1 type VI secretion system secreted protein VgrG [Pseudomonas sp. SJZ078]TWC45368.1 type VI secretion system secreted protein VgrG [Pseudomonas sp. SJZ124]TWC46140.1 type VI secretion system secreted protein VgrG [Pseudomonas sp. SJZ080]TWC80449.1 type VI secretion system secreted protein VgrG [Pseudomonas sp. SJZ10
MSELSSHVRVKSGQPRCAFTGLIGSHAWLFAGLTGDEGLSQLFEYKVNVLSPNGVLRANELLGKPLAVLLPYGINTDLDVRVKDVRFEKDSEQLTRVFDHPLGPEGPVHDLDAPFEDLAPEALLETNIKVLSSKPLERSLPDESVMMRTLHAYIVGFKQVADQGRMPCYELLLRPWLWFSSCASHCRIFQDQSVVDVLKTVLADYPGEVEWATTESYNPLGYCVQYGETDFDFVSRLMENAGMYYFFRHTVEGHCLVITDASTVHKPIDGEGPLQWRAGNDALVHSLWGWEPHHTLCTGRISATDFDFTKANTREASVLKAEAAVAMDHEQTAYEHYRYPGHFNSSAAGEYVTRIEAQALSAEQLLVSTTGCAPYLPAGACFTLSEHPDDRQNVQHLIVRAHLDAFCTPSNYGVSAPRFECKVTAMPSNRQYRAQFNTLRQKIAGPQTAFVVGKEGEPLWVDEFGRIKIQFHWDRGEQNNENCSCWVRVAQPWAGQNRGAIFLPRVGQEVLVEFLDGNPDRPLVTGCLYNGGMRAPYELPAQAARSGIKSQSLGDEDVYNELRFEDKDGAEQLLFYAGRNQDTTVVNDALENIGNERHLIVGASSFSQIAKDSHEQVGGDHNRQVAADHSLEVGGDHNLQIKGGHSLEVGGDQQSAITGAHSLEVGADSDAKVGGKFKLGASSVDLKSSKTITLEAGQTLTLKAGESTLVLGPKGVSINGTLVTIDGKSKVDINSGGGGSANSAEEPKPKKPQKAKKAEKAKEADDGRD